MASTLPTLQAGMHLLSVSSHKLEPQGVTVVAGIAESHLTIHTWPEVGAAMLDVFTCGSGVLQHAASPPRDCSARVAVHVHCLLVLPRALPLAAVHVAPLAMLASFLCAAAWWESNCSQPQFRTTYVVEPLRGH